MVSALDKCPVWVAYCSAWNLQFVCHKPFLRRYHPGLMIALSNVLLVKADPGRSTVSSDLGPTLGHQFSGFSVARLVTIPCSPSPTPRISDPRDLGGTGKRAFLTSSQVVLILPVLGSHTLRTSVLCFLLCSLKKNKQTAVVLELNPCRNSKVGTAVRPKAAGEPVGN